MRPVNVEAIGEELAIKWDDGGETYIRLETLRRHCPCATCQGEGDIMGNIQKGPSKPLSPRSFQLRQIATVGGYALQPIWEDGHSSGIYSFEYIRKIAQSAGPS
ncbi:MAG: DUF971 domain-containing protein [Candidatus Omnitrophica bacterium]|nr:DUF971 domain-containing protein [Candidatus Omnitrophota bacterium]